MGGGGRMLMFVWARTRVVQTRERKITNEKNNILIQTDINPMVTIRTANMLFSDMALPLVVPISGSGINYSREYGRL